MSLLAALAGCAAPPPAAAPTVIETLTVPDTPLVTAPSPWTYPGGDAEPGPVDTDALAAAIEAAVVDVLAFPADPLVDAYLDRYARSATAPCPAAVDDGAGNVYWANGCAAADGTWFGGYLTWYSLGGNIALIDPDGGTLDLEGTAARLTGLSLDGTTRYVQSALVGGFALDAADAEGWLTAGMQSLELIVTRIEVPALTGVVTVVEGAVVPRLGDDVYSVRFTGATVASAILGSACEGEPGGGVVVRDPAGRWVEVTFHGPILDVTEGDAARCDGCGDAVLLSDGTPLGEVCADFSPWLTPEPTP
jgi:hypothetical protein